MKKLLFSLISVFFILSSCSFGAIEKKDGTVTIPNEQIRSITDKTQEIFDLLKFDFSEFSIIAEVKGDYNDKKEQKFTVNSLNNDESFSFNDIDIGSKVIVSIKVVVGEDIIIYSGESEEIVINEGENSALVKISYVGPRIGENEEEIDITGKYSYTDGRGELYITIDSSVSTYEELTKVLKHSEIKTLIQSYDYVYLDLSTLNISKIDAIEENGQSKSLFSDYFCVSIPDTVTEIGDNAFINCTKLVYLVAKDFEYDLQNVTSIGENAFNGCSTFAGIYTPNLETLGSYAFKDCSTLMEIKLSSKTVMQNNSFDGVTAINKVIYLMSYNEEQYPVHFNKKETSVEVRIDGINDSTFKTFLDSDSNTYVDKCLNLYDETFNTLNLPYVLDLSYCNGLTIITSDEKATPSSLFKTYQKVIISEIITKIESYAFKDCTELTTVETKNNLVSAVTSIGESAFEGCSSLKEVTFHKLTEISSNAFKDCTALETCILNHNGLIQANAFSGCENLSSLIFVNDIENYTYTGESNELYCVITLSTEVENTLNLVPYNINDDNFVSFFNTIPTMKGTNIANSFGNSKNLSLQAVNQTNTFTRIPKKNNNSSYFGNYFTSICLPETVTEFESGTFDNCTLLKEITIPSRITEIPANLFYSCTLETVKFSSIDEWSIEGGAAPFTPSSSDYTQNATQINNSKDKKWTKNEPQQDPVITQSRGDVLKDNITIDEIPFLKTTEIVIIPQNTTVEISMTDDSAWDGYYSGTEDAYKGVFLKDRKVKLSPYAMSAYEVTQDLYTEVMGSNPSGFTTDISDGEDQIYRPVEKVSWYDAIAFCNELTKLTLDESECVYFSDESFTTVYTTTDAGNKVSVYIDTTKKGYRLPTEAEWEFAARGGDTLLNDWRYAFSGVQTEIEPAQFTKETTDSVLNDYAWYNNGATGAITHEVGKKNANSLGLYDMSGNVFEWCYDYYNADVVVNDSVYLNDSFVLNPLGATSGNSHIARGGYYSSSSHKCAVSHRNNESINTVTAYIGIRLVRSL